MIVGGDSVSTTPASSARIRPVTIVRRRGKRPLRAVEEAARSLAPDVDRRPVHMALLHPSAPSDIVSGNRPRLAMPAEMLHMNDARLWVAASTIRG